MALTLRLVKGSPLTFIETDDNFSQLANLESGVHTGQLLLTASTTNKASLRIPHGNVPTFPVNGDMWTTSTGLYIQINGSTVGPLGIGGGGSAGVTSFNTRTGAVTLNSPDVTNALGYTPANRAGETFLGIVVAAASSTSAASIRLPHGSAPNFPANGDMWTTADGLYVRINGVTVGPLGGGGGGSYLPIAGGTLTGLLTTATSTTTSAGIRLPHGSAPTSPINGDMWTTTAGVFARINGATVGPFGSVDLSNLNASNLTSGTVPSARISGAYTGITAVGTLTSLTSSGNVGGSNILANPSGGVNGNIQFYDQNGTGSFNAWLRSAGQTLLYDSSSATVIMTLTSGGTTIPGTMTAASFNTSSSREIKKNIRKVRAGALNRVLNLAKQIKEYQLKVDSTGKVNVGVIAEDTPLRYSDGKSVNINNILFDLVAAIGELHGQRV